MDNRRFDDRDKRFDSVYSKKVNAGKRRTYFFDVQKTKGNDFYITLTESTKKFDRPGFERHKIFLYKEDFNRFLTNLEEAINHVKTELMPDYDYDEFDRRHEEWEARREEEGFDNNDEDDDRGNRDNGGGGFRGGFRKDTDRSERPEKTDRPERPERPEKTERPERRERPDRPERTDRTEFRKERSEPKSPTSHSEPDDDMSW